MFESLIGNATVKGQLERLLSAERVPNALLFAGPEGIGKRLFAFELARAFVCGQPNALKPCGNCFACMRVGEIAIPKAEKGEEYDRVFFGSHSDVGLVVPYKRNLRVGSIRALETEANFRPYEARARFFIVDDADKMNDAAANALLKTLEEPPPTSYIILISSRPDRLLQTIRSRTHMIRFSPVDSGEIETLLLQKSNYSNDDAKVAARVSNGSIGRAIGIDIAKFRGARERLISVVDNAASGRGIAEMLQIGEQLNDAKNKDDFEGNLDILESLVHDVWFAASGGHPDEMANFDIRDQIANLANGLSGNRPAAWLNEIEKMRQNFAVNINRKIATDALFTKMAA